MRKVMESEVKGIGRKVSSILESEVSKSNKMKQLFDLGLEIKDISERVGVRYNFVYNVISNYVLVNGIETIHERKGGKKEKILDLWKDGHSKKEIVMVTQSNYNYVYKVVKEYESNKKVEQEDTQLEVVGE